MLFALLNILCFINYPFTTFPDMFHLLGSYLIFGRIICSKLKV